MLSSSPSLPPMPDLRVACVILHAQAGGDFFSDTAFACLVADLRDAGLGSQLVHIHYARGADPEPLTVQSLEFLSNFQLIVLDQVWDPQFIARLQHQASLVVATDPNAQWPGVRPNFELAHFLTHRRPLVDLALALRDGTDVLEVANVNWHVSGEESLPSRRQERRYPHEPQELLPFHPVVDAQVFGQPLAQDGTVPPVRRSLEIGSGCPYALPAEQNAEFDGLDLQSADIASKGCSFCFMGGDYRSLPVAQVVALSIAQIRYWQKHLARLDEIIVRDQSALRYLPALIEALLAAGLKPVGLLLPGRGDAILRYGAELRQAAALLHGTGSWFCIHLIGFESFSRTQLQRYNKGVTPEEYASALVQMRELAVSFPDSFRLGLYGASSFILFDPWVTLAELQETVDFCEHHGAADLAQGLTLTRLRLYPNLPLYWKAKRDALLLDAPAPSDRGASFTGYSAEATWRYQDPQIQWVEDVLRVLHPLARPQAGLGLLAALLRLVRHGPERPPPALVAAELASLRTLWRNPVQSDRTEMNARKQQASRTVVAGKACNNQCQTCIADRGYHSQNTTILLQQIDQAIAAHGRVVLMGREPALWPNLGALLQHAVQNRAKSLELVTNGRFLANPGVAEKLKRAGLDALLIKRHALDDAQEDAFTQAQGAGAQFWQALAQLRQTPSIRWNLLWIPIASATSQGLALAQRCLDEGATGIQIHVLAAQLELSSLPALGQVCQDVRDLCQLRGAAFGIDGF